MLELNSHITAEVWGCLANFGALARAVGFAAAAGTSQSTSCAGFALACVIRLVVSVVCAG